MSKRAVAAAIQAWCEKRGKKLTRRPCHIFPQAYVVGYAAPGCLVVAVPWMDAEPQVQDFDRANPLKIIRRFDGQLRAGNWCSVAYVCCEGCQELVAIPVVSARRISRQET